METMKIAFCIWMIFVPMEAQEATNETTPLDIIILVDVAESTINANVVNVIRQFPDTFTVEENETHVALVTFSNETEIKLNLSFDLDKFRAAVNQLSKIKQNGQRRKTWDGLDVVHQHVLARDHRKGVPSVLILFQNGCPVYEGQYFLKAWIDVVSHFMELTEKAARMLRDENVVIFLLYFGDDFCEGNRVVPVQNHLTNVVGGDPKHLFRYRNFKDLNSTIFGLIKKKIERDFCRYELVCFYTDNQKKTCDGDWQKMNSSCIEWTPNSKGCNRKDCENSCEKRFNGTDCDAICSEKPPKICDGCRRCQFIEPKAVEPKSLGAVGVAVGVVGFLLVIAVGVWVIVLYKRKLIGKFRVS